VFPVRYELNSYINLLRNSVFKWLRRVVHFKFILVIIRGESLSSTSLFLDVDYRKYGKIYRNSDPSKVFFLLFSCFDSRVNSYSVNGS
jgi:hypothetical protein